MPDFYHDKVFPFEVDHIALELLGDHETLRYLAGIAWFPEGRDVLWRGLLAHDLHNVGGRNRSGIGKAIQEGSDAEEMIAVAVGDIDRGQVLAARRDPLLYGACQLDCVRKASTRTASRLP